MPALGRAASYGIYSAGGGDANLAFTIAAIDAATPTLRRVGGEVSAFMANVDRITAAAASKAATYGALRPVEALHVKALRMDSADMARMRELRETLTPSFQKIGVWKTDMARTATEIKRAETALNGLKNEAEFYAAVNHKMSPQIARDMALRQKELDRLKSIQLENTKAVEGEQQAISKLTPEYKQLQGAYRQTFKDQRDYLIQLDRAVKSHIFDVLATTTADIAKGFMMVGLAAGGAAAALSLAFITKGAEVDAFMHQFKAVTNDTTDAVGRLQDGVANLAASLPMAAGSIAQAYLRIAKAGVHSAEDVEKVFGAAFRLSIANTVDAGAAAEKLIQILKSMSLSYDEAGHAAALLQYFTNESIADFEDMIQGFKYAGQFAHLAGQDINFLGAAIAILSNTGLEASIAGRYMRQLFTDIAKDLPGFTAAMAHLGVTVRKNNNGAVDMIDLLKQLSVVVQKNNGNVALLESIMEGLNVRAGTALINLAAHFEDFQRLVNESRGSLGDLDRQFAEMSDSMQSYITRLQNLFVAPFQTKGFTDLGRDFFKSFYEGLDKAGVVGQFGEMIATFIIILKDNLPTVIELLKQMTSQGGAMFGIMEAGLRVLMGFMNLLTALGPSLGQGILLYMMLGKAFGFSAMNAWQLQTNLALVRKQEYLARGDALAHAEARLKLNAALVDTVAYGARVASGMIIMGMAARDSTQFLVLMATMIMTQLVPALVQLAIAKALTWASAMPLLIPLALGMIGGGLAFMYSEGQRAREEGSKYTYNINNMYIKADDTKQWEDATRRGG